MNKYMMLMTIVLFDILMVSLAAAMTGFGTSGDILTAPGALDPTPLGFLGSIFEIIPFFFRLVFFQVTGVPEIIVLVVFYPINIALFWLVIAMIRGTD